MSAHEILGSADRPLPRSLSRARAYWVTGPLQGELRTEDLAPPGPDEVLVRTLFSGISRGTEALILSGQVPPGEYQSMRAPFQAGEFPWPVKYGYCNVGRVEIGPPDWLGQTVFCLYPHQTRYCVPTSALHRIPEQVPPGRAVLAANLETALNGLWDAAPRLGDRIAVIGAGTLGVLSAWLASRIPGCQVELIDLNPGRAEIAERLGLAFATPEQATAEADLVIHASGNPAGLDLAITLAAFEATILELSWFGTMPATLALGGAFHGRRLTIRSSQVGQIATTQRARWDHRRRLALALRLLDDDRLEHLISGEDHFDDLPGVYPRLVHARGETLMHRIRYDP
ncbi:dehydrogenase [Thiocapsa imhoffii]|uniref:Dehydrogenase n=1 Tax=Thiocapsa imhoffii TaxID=382777 RepID=A0A9X0WJK3_9GAMM|nr:zinc-binding alcohol dehydrogenase [Thiocapsa imhoffii]MBK1645773.1 dehydrogenase [Thiocapsa imhoffii]